MVKFLLKLIGFFKTLMDILNANSVLTNISQKYECYIHHNAIISCHDLNKLIIGKYSSIGAYTIIDINDNTKENISRLTIGNNTYIGELNNIRASGGVITIGDNCLISQNINIIATNHQFEANSLVRNQPWRKENNFVTIGHDVWIGAGSIILPGIHIGDGCVIGAGSVVTKSIESNHIVAGNPARIIKMRS